LADQRSQQREVSDVGGLEHALDPDDVTNAP